jgi:hypothetical protein
MTNDKRNSLIKYAEYLKHRILAPIPIKHQKDPVAFKQMLEIDLKKTLNKIEKG